MVTDIVFSDVVDGPLQNIYDGHHSWLFKSWLFRWPFRGTLHGRVNALDMIGAVRDIDPGVVMSFGTWQNTLCDWDLDDGGYSKHFRATRECHNRISGRQTKVFKGPEFLTSVVCSVPVQASNASWQNTFCDLARIYWRL